MVEKNRLRSFQYKLLDKIWEDDINTLYSHYSKTTKLPEEFLAVSNPQSVREVLDSSEKFFMGIVVDFLIGNLVDLMILSLKEELNF